MLETQSPCWKKPALKLSSAWNHLLINECIISNIQINCLCSIVARLKKDELGCSFTTTVIISKPYSIRHSLIFFSNGVDISAGFCEKGVNLPLTENDIFYSSGELKPIECLNAFIFGLKNS